MVNFLILSSYRSDFIRRDAGKVLRVIQRGPRASGPESLKATPCLSSRGEKRRMPYPHKKLKFASCKNHAAIDFFIALVGLLAQKRRYIHISTPDCRMASTVWLRLRRITAGCSSSS